MSSCYVSLSACGHTIVVLFVCCMRVDMIVLVLFVYYELICLVFVHG